MQTKQIIHTVSCHAEGEVGDVIIGGVPVPPGETLISENLSSVHGSTAALNQKRRWGSWMLLSRVFPGGHGLPELTSICWIQGIPGLAGIEWPTPGRKLNKGEACELPLFLQSA
jgi:hypothetical protein